MTLNRTPAHLVQIAGSLGDKGILLKLPAGSQEAGYLAALYPLPKTPTLVIMTCVCQPMIA